jgi:hypothetical protein
MDSGVRWHSVVFFGRRLTVVHVRMHTDLRAEVQSDLTDLYCAEVLHTDDQLRVPGHTDARSS